MVGSMESLPNTLTFSPVMGGICYKSHTVNGLNSAWKAGNITQASFKNQQYVARIN